MEISTATRIKIYKAIYRPMPERLKIKLQAMEMKYLRKVNEITRVDKKMTK